MMKKHGWWIITLVIISVVIGFLVVQAKKPGKYDNFAQCISDSGAKFYGTWWCPHCQAQKALFGKSAQLLPYEECQTRSRKNTPICIEKEITSYPTWIFTDGTRVSGEQTFDQLASYTSCTAPTL